MSFIDIPKGKTEIRMADGNWVNIPDGVTQVDSTKLWQEPKQEQTSINPFSETGRLIDDPVGTIKSAGEQIANTDFSLSGLADIGKDIVGGSVYGTGDLVDFVGDTFSGGLPQAGLRLYNTLTGGKETQGALEAQIDPLAQSLKDTGVSLADDPNSATFNVATLTGGGEAALAKTVPLVGKAGKAIVANPARRIMESPDEAVKISSGWIDEAPVVKSGVTPREQTMANVDVGGEKTIGVYQQAIQDGGDDARRALGKNLENKQKAIDEASRKNDIEEVSKVSARMYDDMVKTVARDNKSVYDATSLADDLEVIGSLTARSDKSERTIKALQDTLSKNKNLSLEQALDFRKDINAELVNATGDTYKNWKRMKDNVDGFIKENSDSSLHGFIDDTIQTYSRAKKNEELVEIIGKNKFDYQKTLDEIKRANISSPEVETSVEILSDFANKFKNDKAISGMIPTKGSDKAGSAILTVMSGLVNQVTGFVAKGIGLQKGKNVIVQGNVLKEVLAKSKSPEEFITRVSKMTETPNDIKDRLLKHLKATRQSHKSNPSAKPIVNTDIERNLRKSQRDRNLSQNTMDKAQDRVNSLDDEIMDLENRIEIAIEKGKATGNLRKRKSIAETRLDRAEKDLSIKSDKHAEVSNKFDKELSDSGYEIDEMGKFTFPSKAEARSKVSIPEKDLP